MAGSGLEPLALWGLGTLGFRGPMWLDLCGLRALHSLVWLVLWGVQALGGLGPLAAGPGDFEVL